MARPVRIDLDAWHMAHALSLAARGQGAVEPNPLVGCVIAHGAEIVGEGWHQRFGGPHAEIEALRVAGERARGATLYTTLEPCCHEGKTPPCTRAIIRAGLRRVVAAQLDPFPAVAGKGLAELAAAGVQTAVGIGEVEARALNAPYLKLLATGRPWLIAKWAMSLDGKLATATGDSRWISGEASRAVTHALRGRVDAIVVGSRTAAIDNPLLTARPPGPRTALRVVVDSQAGLSLESQLVRTASDVPVCVAVSETAPASNCQRLADAGCQVLPCAGATHLERLGNLLAQLGARRCTNVLVEGGATLLGACFEGGFVDEVHVFVAPKVLGGGIAATAGDGARRVADTLRLVDLQFAACGEDVHLSGRLRPRA